MQNQTCFKSWTSFTIFYNKTCISLFRFKPVLRTKDLLGIFTYFARIWLAVKIAMPNLANLFNLQWVFCYGKKLPRGTGMRAISSFFGGTPLNLKSSLRLSPYNIMLLTNNYHLSMNLTEMLWLKIIKRGENENNYK